MPAADSLLLDQTGGLQRLFHETIGHRHAVLALRNLMKVAHIEPRIAFPVQPQQRLNLSGGHAVLRRAEQPLSTNPRYPWASDRSRQRRKLRGDQPRISAARNQCSSPPSAFNITS